ncbi:uncharacterized protein LOC141899306 isoform X2 [Tubulanus polymorphus]|uniref:uncharacterized protein LOC141899306 isoform X2 n=1 Tax=Tubulanus polymorphus TaxID=672921 RepID=UPI003DA535A0
MWKLREITDKVTNVVMNYSEVEAKVRDATNDDPWGPTGTVMQEIAQYTFTYEHFPEVMGMLWKRMLHDNKKNWRRVYKGLLLLAHLVRNGSERVVTSSREHIYDLRQLEAYTFVDENGKDQGINVRQKGKDLLELIQDDDRLRDERKRAKKNKDKYVGLSGESMAYRYSDRYDEEPRRKSKLDDFDEFDKGNKSKAVEALDKVKELWHSRSRSFDDGSDHRYSAQPEEQTGSGSSPPWAKKSTMGHHYAFPSVETPDDNDVYEPEDKNYEFHDDEEFTHIERTHTTKTEKITNRRTKKKVDLGAASNFGKETQSQNTSANEGPSLIDTMPHPNSSPDLFSDFQKAGTTSTNANGQFADFSNFDARQRSTSNSSSNFGDFSQFNNPQTQQSSGDFGDFSSFQSSSGNSNAAITRSSSVDLLAGLSHHIQPPLSAQPLQSTQPVLTHSQTQPTMNIGMGMQMNMNGQMIGMMSMPGQMPMAQQPMMSSQQPMSQIGVTQISSPPMGQVPMGIGVSQPQQPGMMGVMQPTANNNVPVGVMQPMSSNTSTVGMMPPISASAPATPMKSQHIPQSISNSNNTWAGVGVDISLDSLSPASKYQKQTAPSMNQLQQTSQQQFADFQGFANFDQSPGMGPGIAPNMYPQSQMFPMGTGPIPSQQQQQQPATQLTQQMSQLNMQAGGAPLMAPNMGMGVQQTGGMMSMTMTRSQSSTLQQRADQAFSGLGSFTAK